MEVSLERTPDYRVITVTIDGKKHVLEVPYNITEQQERAYVDKFMDELKDTFIDAGGLYDSN